jgi:hypothetical protein
MLDVAVQRRAWRRAHAGAAATAEDDGLTVKADDVREAVAQLGLPVPDVPGSARPPPARWVPLHPHLAERGRPTVAG